MSSNSCDGRAVQRDRVVSEAGVQLQHGVGADVAGEPALGLGDLCQDRVEVLLGGITAACVQVAAAAGIGLVHQPRAHGPIRDRLVAERHRELGLGVRDLVGQQLDPVADVPLGRVLPQLHRSSLGLHRPHLLQRCQIRIPLVDGGDLECRFQSGRVPVVLVERVSVHRFELLAEGGDRNRHEPYTKPDAAQSCTRPRDRADRRQPCLWRPRCRPARSTGRVRVPCAAW